MGNKVSDKSLSDEGSKQKARVKQSGSKTLSQSNHCESHLSPQSPSRFGEGTISNPLLRNIDGDGRTEADPYESSIAGDSEDLAELNETVQNLFEEEESLLNLHMSVIQENADLLTEEGRLLQSVQGGDLADYDIGQYASQLCNILDRKTHLISLLRDKLNTFRQSLRREEELSRKVGYVAEY